MTLGHKMSTFRCVLMQSWCLQTNPKAIIKCDVVNGWLLFRRTFKCSSTGFGEKRTLYDALELDPTATSSEIKETYLQLSKKYHPDRNPNDEDAAQRFYQVSQAYTTLGNAKLRRMYDKGQLGRAISVADREQISHTFEGAAFVQNRSNLREKFANSDKNMWKNSKDHQEDYVRKSSSWNFHQNQMWKKGLNTSLASPTKRGAKPVSTNDRKRFDVHESSSGSGGGVFSLVLILGLMFLAFKLLA